MARACRRTARAVALYEQSAEQGETRAYVRLGDLYADGDAVRQDYGQAVVPDWFGLYAGLEAAASRLRCFEPEFVHGLLQTQEYARAVIAADDQISEDVLARRRDGADA